MSAYHGEKRSRSRSNEDRRTRGKFEDRNEIRLIIRSKDAGAVIGRGGENVKKLRYDHNSNVTVTDSRTPERLVVMSGEEEGLIGILVDISNAFLEKNAKDKGSGKKRSKRERGDGDEAVVEEEEEEELELKMLIHNSQAGCVIGKGGNKLKELRHDLQCEVKVFPECCPRSSERIVLAIGRSKQISKALVHIHEMLKAWPPKGMIEYYDPNCYDPEAVPDYGGYFDNDDDWGRRSSRRMREFRGSRDDDRRGGGGGGGGGGVGGGGGGYDRGRRYRDEPPMLMASKSTQKVSIPAELAGVIIGKQGSNIRKIRNETGAEVDIDDVGGGENDRIILIYGTADQITNAQAQLQMSVKQHLAKNA